MDHKSEILLNLIHAFIDQVESGETYPEALGSSDEETEYIGFSLIIGIEADGSYNHSAYGYESNDVNYIMQTNFQELQPYISDFVETIATPGASQACLIEIPEELDGTTADFLYGRDAEVWMHKDIRLAPFVNPVYSQEKNVQWNADVYRKIHGEARPEGLPFKQVTTSFFDPSVTIQGAVKANPAKFIPETGDEPDTLEARDSRYITLDFDQFPELSPHATEDENSYLFDATPGTAFKEEYSFISGEEALRLAPEKKKSSGKRGLFGHKHQDEEDEFMPEAEEIINDYVQKAEQKAKFAQLLDDSDEFEDFSQPDTTAPAMEEPTLSPGLIISSSKPVPAKVEPAKPARIPQAVAKDDIMPTMVRESQKELKGKGIPATSATIVIYLQPPVVTSYGFWYKDGNRHIQGHWMPESYDIDDAIDAFLRDTIPDPKDPWDVCIIRMDYTTKEATTEFLKGKSAYPWMEVGSSRSQELTDAGKFGQTAADALPAAVNEPRLKSLHGTGVSEEVPTSQYF